MSAVLSSAPARAASKPQALSRAGQLFLAVFIIVVYEGAVRKWVTSASSLPLIGLRDLCAAWLVLYAWRRGYLRQQTKITAAMFAWSLLVFGWGLLQLAAGESSPLIFVIGLRFWLLYTWFAVAAAASMNETDYRAALLTAGWMMILMAPLAVLQHYSPPGAWINVQVDGGDDEEGIFTVVVGVVRTTGTFSFTSGYATFMGLLAPIVFGLLSARKPRNKHYLFATAVFIAFLVGSLVSGSRTAFIFSGMMFMAYLVGRLVFSRMQQKPAAAVGVVMALVLVGIFAIFFREAIDVTQTRFEQASEVEDFWGRVQTILVGEPHVFETVNWLGWGIGYGSNLANFVRTGSISFTLAESEGGRIMLEGGLLGIVYVGLKLLVIVIGLFKSFRLSMKTHSPYPVLVWLAAALAILTWPSSGQLTANGLLGIILAFALLLFRFPRLEIFHGRASKT